MIHLLLKLPILKRLIPSLAIRILKIIKKNRGYFKIKNFKMFLDFLDPIDREIILFQEFEKLEIDYLIKQMSKMNPHYFLDIGSNCGYYSISIANKFPNIQIFSFEPNQEAYLKFNKTLKANTLLAKKIKSYNFGLSDSNAKLKIKSLIKHGYVQTGGSSINRNYKKGSFQESLENFKIADEFLKIKHSIIILKIDVEGHEFEILKGLQKIVKLNKCMIQIEIFDKYFFKVNNFLSSLGFITTHKIKKRSNYFYKNFI